ncbi:MAG: GIY-YIG nuclease family protein [Acidobacteria bacterium]|nr:GIY-YIG nuclease family protein [Acidobacteriota bacterium]MYH22545.1 GIY-YIG nuclease family protein [Acidobacteriota bacterium]
MPGTVYLLTNEAMPGLVKIGKTTNDDPQVRMGSLYTTGVPVPFECVLAMKVENPTAVEHALHIAFGPNRVNPRREFFKIDPEQSVAVLELLGIEDVTPQVNSENDGISDAERNASKALKSRRPNLNFSEMGIPLGSALQAVATDDTVTVVSDRRVLYKEEEISLTEATKRSLGVDYAVAPARHWSHEGRNLSEIYNETYPLDSV